MNLFGIELHGSLPMYGSKSDGPGMDDVRATYDVVSGSHLASISWYAANDLIHRVVGVGDSFEAMKSNLRRSLTARGRVVFGGER